MAGMIGASGRPPQPTRLLVLKGTARKGRHFEGRKGEPKPRSDGSIPPCPDHLEGEVRKVYQELAGVLKFRIFSDEDVYALVTMASMLVEWRRCFDHIQRHGHSTVTRGREIHSHESKTWLDLNGRLLNYFARFGMTPADRARVREVEGANGNQENPDDEFSKPQIA